MLLAVVLAQPLSVCASPASMLSRRLHVEWEKATELAFQWLSCTSRRLLSQTLLYRGPFYLNHARMELRDSPPSIFTIREKG